MPDVYSSVSRLESRLGAAFGVDGSPISCAKYILDQFGDLGLRCLYCGLNTVSLRRNFSFRPLFGTGIESDELHVQVQLNAYDATKMHNGISVVYAPCGELGKHVSWHGQCHYQSAA
jgi:hypothetical protein